MKERAEAMVFAAFAADSLALGPHWIYDTDRIKNLFGRVEDLIEPSEEAVHSTKGKGDFTHYGDQMFVLLESLGALGKFDSSDFSRRWRELFRDYQGYIDQATRITLDRYSQGFNEKEAGSPSNDLAGASRIAPVVYAYRNDLDGMVRSARAQTQITHRDPFTVDSAEFFSRTARLVLQDTSPGEALRQVAEEHFTDSPITQWVNKGLESTDEDSVKAITRFGQTCHTTDAFPGVVHLIAKYEQDLKEALIQSVMAGGDNAARGMMVGMILGAHLGLDALPDEWLSGINKKREITKLLEKL